MAACIATTSSVTLAQDGAGTLRANAVVSPGNNNPLISQADGLAVKAQHVTYGWPFAGDDTYFVAVGVSPAMGYTGYGPEMFAQSQTSTPGCVTARINWEIQAAYPGTSNHPFSGISYALQVSHDHTNWLSIADASQISPTGQTWRWQVCGNYPICFNDNGLHNFWARMLVAAGAFGFGENITAQLTAKRSITMMY